MARLPALSQSAYTLPRESKKIVLLCCGKAVANTSLVTENINFAV